MLPGGIGLRIDAAQTFRNALASRDFSLLCERFREWPVREQVEIVALLTIVATRTTGLQLTMRPTFFRPARTISWRPREPMGRAKRVE
jgi:hypothetical protein